MSGVAIMVEVPAIAAFAKLFFFSSLSPSAPPVKAEIAPIKARMNALPSANSSINVG